MVADAGVLYERRPSGSEKTNRPVAEPAAARFHVPAFRDTEFAARLLDVSAKAVEPAGRLVRIDQAPVMAAQRREIVRFAFVNQQRQLDGLRRFARQLQKPQKLLAFRSVIFALKNR